MERTILPATEPTLCRTPDWFPSGEKGYVEPSKGKRGRVIKFNNSFRTVEATTALSWSEKKSLEIFVDRFFLWFGKKKKVSISCSYLKHCCINKWMNIFRPWWWSRAELSRHCHQHQIQQFMMEEAWSRTCNGDIYLFRTSGANYFWPGLSFRAV